MDRYRYIRNSKGFRRILNRVLGTGRMCKKLLPVWLHALVGAGFGALVWKDTRNNSKGPELKNKSDRQPFQRSSITVKSSFGACSRTRMP